MNSVVGVNMSSPTPQPQQQQQMIVVGGGGGGVQQQQQHQQPVAVVDGGYFNGLGTGISTIGNYTAAVSGVPYEEIAANQNQQIMNKNAQFAAPPPVQHVAVQQQPQPHSPRGSAQQQQHHQQQQQLSYYSQTRPIGNGGHTVGVIQGGDQQIQQQQPVVYQQAVMASPDLSAQGPALTQLVVATPTPGPAGAEMTMGGPSGVLFEEVMAQNRKLLQRNQHLEHQVTELGRQLEAANTELADSRGDTFKVSEQLRALEDVTLNNHEHFVSASDALTAANEKLIEEAANDKASLISLFVHLRAAYAESRKTVARMAEQRAIDLATIQEKNNALSGLTAEMNESSALIARIDRIQAEHDELVRRLRSKVASKHHQVAELREEVDTATDALFQANETIELLRERVNEMEEERDRKKQYLSSGVDHEDEYVDAVEAAYDDRYGNTTATDLPTTMINSNEKSRLNSGTAAGILGHSAFQKGLLENNTNGGAY